MRVLSGLPLAPGQAAGRIFVYEPRPAAAPAAPTLASAEARAAEIARFRAALAATLRQLAAREAEWTRRGGGEARFAFIAYQAALEDQGLWSGVAGEIDRAGCDAAHGLLAATARLAGVLAGVRDAMHQERRRHLEEASGWLWRRLLGRPGPALAEVPPGSIVVAEDLPPAELLLADPRRVAGMAVAAADSRLTGIPNPAGIPLAAGVSGLPVLARHGQRAWLRVEAAAELQLDPPAAAWEAAAAAAGALRRQAALARTADGVAIPLWVPARSPRAAQQALAAGAGGVLLWAKPRPETEPAAGCWLVAPLAGDLAAPLRLAEALAAGPGPAPVAALAEHLADLAAVPALLARHRRVRRRLAAVAVHLGTLAEPSHPGVLQVLQTAAAACARERLPLAVGGHSEALRLLPLWLGAGAVAWWGEVADAAVLRERAARLQVAACREAFPQMLAATAAEAVAAAAENLYT